METSLITGKYQITLPKRVRKALGAEVGDRLTFVREEDGAWRILMIPGDPLKALRLAGKGLTPANVSALHAEYEREAADGHRD